MAQVTVALSVYNVDEYVRASLDCIVNQTMHDIEILCIDDASTDDTWKILQEYASRDERISLWRMEQNGGLSVSRNKAIELAKGEYIIMLDGDDLFAPDMVENAYNKATETGADMVLWDYCVFYRDAELPSKLAKPSELNKLDVNDKVALLRRPAFTWTKLIKMSVLRDHGIHFTPGLTKQDIPIHWKLITSDISVAVLPSHLSYYRQQPGSTTNRRGRSLFSLAKVMDIVGEDLRARGLYDKYRNEYLRSRLSLLQGMQDFIKPELKNEALTMILERYDKDARAYVNSPQCELTIRVRDFYGMLDGRLLPGLRYKTTMLVRAVYRKLR